MKKKLSLSTVLIAVLIICGLGLILYPTLSDMYATRQYNKEIEAYNAERTRETAERNAKLWADAEEYNRDLLKKTEQFSVSSEELTRVEGLLNPLGNGMMGYVNIPKIDVALPVYQGTDEKELQSGAGWWIGSSLPTGGESAHCIITAHTGLSKAKLFTDIDQLEVGDRFSLTILDRTLVYEVDQILVTEPTDFEPLYIVEGKDYATLYTCTPYGVNTHRLLVRGVRVDDAPAAAEKTGVNWKLIVGVVLLLAIIAAVVYIIIRRRKTASGQPAAAVEPEVPAVPPAETGGGTPPAPVTEARLRPAAAAKRRAPTGYVGKHCAPSGTRKESSRSTGKQ